MLSKANSQPDLVHGFVTGRALDVIQPKAASHLTSGLRRVPEGGYNSQRVRLHGANQEDCQIDDREAQSPDYSADDNAPHIDD